MNLQDCHTIYVYTILVKFWGIAWILLLRKEKVRQSIAAREVDSPFM
jgi:hypothetical protein